ncbi:ACP S-malonyltransferase [uncultured Eubacterium sp.]|uniref:ACP S-malonyltransferase n=1 Tax=uncultured Eubacterium sp. TaxID=165185 RepID=UPI00267107C7|nr:ACP S-malonyltransferase [uncultured Eubacterium sp.]
MSKIAFVYPGQGVQSAGMGKDFFENSAIAKVVYIKANEVLDFSVTDICFVENSNINNTEYTQAALVTTYLAMTDEIVHRGIYPDVAAGLSLGEYAAIAAAGGMAQEDAIKTVRQRGILMNRAVPAGEGTMAAILGMAAEEIDNVIDGIEDVSVANYNCPGQIVITGKKKAVFNAMKVLETAGARRTVELNVSGPFHSELLKEAGEQLGKVLRDIELHPLRIPYVTNVTGEYVTNINTTKELLARQVYSPVKWEQSVRKMIENGVDTFIEIGPGKTIAGFLRKIDKTVKCINISKFEDLEKLKDIGN